MAGGCEDVRGRVRHLRDKGYQIVVVVVLGALAGTAAYVVWSSVTRFDTALAEIASEQFEPDTVRQQLAQLSDTEVDSLRIAISDEQKAALKVALERELESLEAEQQALAAAEEILASAQDLNPLATSPPLPDEMFDTILLVGADASGYLADAIVYLILPTDGSTPMMVSIPRDLYLPNRCTRGYNRINTNLGGCKGYASGPELLALAVEDFTGIEVDHYARVNFDGFRRVIDGLGGITVCVSNPTRDFKSELELDSGCTRADGATALAWVRSRHTEQLIDEEWKTVAASDFARQKRQQDVLFQLAGSLSRYQSVSSLTNALNNLSYAVRMDRGWTVTEAASFAFRYRGISKDDVIRLSIPVDNFRAPSGALVLINTKTFNEVLSKQYAKAAR